jgi:hypothetical protein
MTHSTEALAERYLNGSQLILGNLSYMQTVHILQLVCAVTDSLPRGQSGATALGCAAVLFKPTNQAAVWAEVSGSLADGRG